MQKKSISTGIMLFTLLSTHATHSTPPSAGENNARMRHLGSLVMTGAISVIIGGLIGFDLNNKSNIAQYGSEPLSKEAQDVANRLWDAGNVPQHLRVPIRLMNAETYAKMSKQGTTAFYFTRGIWIWPTLQHNEFNLAVLQRSHTLRLSSDAKKSTSALRSDVQSTECYAANIVAIATLESAVQYCHELCQKDPTSNNDNPYPSPCERHQYLQSILNARLAKGKASPA